MLCPSCIISPTPLWSVPHDSKCSQNVNSADAETASSVEMVANAFKARDALVLSGTWTAGVKGGQDGCVADAEMAKGIETVANALKARVALIL